MRDSRFPEALNRRDLLGAGGLAITATLGGCTTLVSAASPRPFGLADITVMRELREDYAGTLRKVAAMGYSVFGFRLTGYGGREPGEPTPDEKARMVRDAGLEIGVLRLSVRNADYDRELHQIADLGAKIAAMSTAPPFIATREVGKTTRAEFDAWLPQLVAIGEKARKLGLRLAYHNHPYDLQPLGQESPLDSMMRRIPPELLSFEIDLAWAWYGKVDPLALIRRLGPRVASMHWKDIDPSRGTARSEVAVAPGEGEMDYLHLLPRVVELTSATGYVEVDAPTDGLAAAAAGAATIRTALGTARK